MRVGVPKEIKVEEYRVGLTPESVRTLVSHGHRVVVESHAGMGIGATDEDYVRAGAGVAQTAEEVFAGADMIVKVKEPQAAERKLLRADQVLFTYLHLAPDPAQSRDLLASGAVCIAYETVTQAGGGLPLLAPMSEVAGRMAPQVGAHFLERTQGGRGVLLGGATGVAPANVTVLGDGHVGLHATQIALGMQANVTVLGLNATTLQKARTRLGARADTQISSADNIAACVERSDLVVGAVLVPGALAPKLIGRELVRKMRPGSVIVDVSIDQGGCCETSRPTTHTSPTYVEENVVHYCVANMPGVVPYTSTYALNHVTLPHVLALADYGWAEALARDAHLENGLNIYSGKVAHPAVAEALGLPCQPL
jgi:alanine dehydrogenase